MQIDYNEYYSKIAKLGDKGALPRSCDRHLNYVTPQYPLNVKRYKLPEDVSGDDANLRASWFRGRANGEGGVGRGLKSLPPPPLKLIICIPVVNFACDFVPERSKDAKNQSACYNFAHR